MGSNKHKSKKNNKNQHNNNNNSNENKIQQQKISEVNKSELTDEAIEINKLLEKKNQKIKQQKNMVYILSMKWFNQWKQYVGYDNLFKDNNQFKNKIGRNKPKSLNQGLLKQCQNLLNIPQQLQEYNYLNTFINNQLKQDKDYIGIQKQLWQKFTTIYDIGIQIKRPYRKKKQKLIQIDGLLQKCDGIFINYNQSDFYQKIDNFKSSKSNNNQFFYVYKIQFSNLWKLEDFYLFLEKLCEIKYNCKQISIWLCQNFLSTTKIKQNLIKSIKNRTFQINAFKLQKNQYKNIDLSNFIKSHYTLLIEVGESRIKTQKNPEEPNGYCQQCLKIKSLKYHCLCGHRYYCDRECQIDDQLYHFHSCPQAFNDSDDEVYKQKKIKEVSKKSKCGLKNLGNTCYMNSSIQMLLCLDFFVDFFTSNQYLNFISKKQQYAEVYLEKISKTFKMMGSLDFIQPWDLKGQINHFLGPFKGYKQHDALDFLTNFINSINDCLGTSNQQQAYHPIIKNNLIGQFDSLVICPDCKVQVKNTEIFIQLSLPIKKHKTQKIIYNYACFDNPFSYRSGKAEVKNTWAAIKQDIGVSSDCLMFIGSNSQAQNSLVFVTEDQSSENLLKKQKKYLLFFPNVKVNKDQFILPANFIRSQVLSGQNMRANISGAFPVIVKIGKTMGHFYIDLIRYINLGRNQDVLKKLEMKYQEMVNKIYQKNKLEEYKSQITRDSQIKQNNNEKQKNENIKEDNKNQQIDKYYNQLDNELQNILNELKIQVFIQDTKKSKNICFYCKKKCGGCLLNFSFKNNVNQLLLQKKKDIKILIHFINKPQVQNQIVNKTSGNDVTINDCLAYFRQPQILDWQNAWYCSNCQKMKQALKQLDILKFPRYLIIQINRFKNGPNGTKQKNSQPIAYEEYQIIGNHKYKLLSVILHEGSTQGGHYQAICRKEDSFYTFNDSKVSKTNKIINKNAYIFCYQKQQELIQKKNDKKH